MRNIPRSLRIYILGIALTAMAAFVFSLRIWKPSWTVESMALPLVFWVLIALAYIFPLHFPPKQKVIVDTAILFAAILLFDVPTTVFIAVTAFTFSQLILRMPWYAILFNASQLGLLVALAGFVYHSIGPSTYPFSIEGLEQAVAVAGAAITFYVVNTLTVATAVGLQRGMSPFAVWKANWRDDIAEYSALLLLGLLTALIVSVYPWSIVLVALTTSIVYTSLKNGLKFRLKAKEATEEKKKVETLLNETFGGIIELDADLRIRAINPAAEAITGYSLNEVFGKTLPEVWGQDACKEGSALRRAIETRQRIPPEEAIIISKRGVRDVLQGVTPLYDGRGGVRLFGELHRHHGTEGVGPPEVEHREKRLPRTAYPFDLHQKLRRTPLR